MGNKSRTSIPEGGGSAKKQTLWNADQSEVLSQPCGETGRTCADYT